MFVSEVSVKRPVTTLMVMFIIALIGFVSLSRLPIDLYPELEIPVAIVSTSYDGVGPKEIEELITRPLEGVVGTVEGIKNISSRSSEGNSLVILEFNSGTDMNFASLDIREKVDLVKGLLPEDASDPMVLKIDPNAMPVLEMSIVGGNLEDTQRIAEDKIQPRIERLKGVASVGVSGGYEKQIEIELDDEKVAGYGLEISQIVNVLRAENLNLPGGEVIKGKRLLSVRTIGEFEEVEEIRNIPLTLSTGDVIYLRDIGEIKFNYKDVSKIIKTNGEKSISMAVQKQSGTNTVQVARLIKATIDEIRIDYPEYDIRIANDQSLYIEGSISSVVQSAVYGALLAVLILFLFLRNIRTTFIIGISIPVSIVATFILIYFQGITLNLMTLGGLALGIGMLVDNAIVVLENIYRYRQDGYSRKEAAILGAKEVGMAVTASTLTTLAVFLPIVFTEGITSIMFKELALTVSFSLGASLVVSLTLIPMLSSKLLKVDKNAGKHHDGKAKPFNFVFDLFDKFLSALEKAYKRVLKAALRHRLITVIITLVVFAGSLSTAGLVGAEFFPSMDQGLISISVSLPTGSELSETEEVVNTIEKNMAEITEIETLFTSIGSGGNRFLSSASSNVGSITVELKALSERERSSDAVADQIRGLVKDIAGAEIQVSEVEAAMGSMTSVISISVKGDDLEKLRIIGEDFKDIVQEVEGTREVESSFSDGIEEINVKINRDKSSLHGLTAGQVANAVKAVIEGQLSTKFKMEGTEIDVIVKGDEVYSQSIETFKQLSIKTPRGLSVPLSDLADITVERGPVSISRDDQARTVTITGDITGRDLGSVSTDIEAALADYELPDNYILEMGGQNQEMMDSFADLGLALIMAVIIVYMVLASQFESLIHPFTIIVAVPLSFSGAFLGLFLMNKTLSVPSVIGFIILSGIVVNNAIVLVDYINTRRSNGEERKEAILNAGPIRLRPILMTTLTTVLALLPLMLGIGEGSEAIAPLATTVIFGLALSTILTLVIIPVVYTLFDDLTIKLKGVFRSKESVSHD